VAVGAAAPSSDWDVVPVYFGTDRKRHDQPKRIGYGADRGHKLEVGRALVTVPKAHQVPNVERPWAIKVPYTSIVLYQQDEDPKKHFTIQELKALSKEELLALIRDRLRASKTFQDQALVFIHGYNNGFDDALFRTAQIAYDLKYDGAPFLYSWPSGAGIAGYPYDRESAQQAEQYLKQFLLMVLNETGAKSISIIAHSMGNQLLLQVLRNLDHSNPEVARINQIILAAPDVDRDGFEFLASQIQGVSRGITMYASSNDVALGISRRFAGGVPRAGDVPVGGPIVVKGVDTIDVSALSTEYLALNHSSYAEKTGLLRDIELILQTGVRPPEIRLPVLVRVKGDRGDYWRYPK
jgi:esterase/lipase superfamily enzyme